MSVVFVVRHFSRPSFTLTPVSVVCQSMSSAISVDRHLIRQSFPSFIIFPPLVRRPRIIIVSPCMACVFCRPRSASPFPVQSLRFPLHPPTPVSSLLPFIPSSYHPLVVRPHRSRTTARRPSSRVTPRSIAPSPPRSSSTRRWHRPTSSGSSTDASWSATRRDPRRRPLAAAAPTGVPAASSSTAVGTNSAKRARFGDGRRSRFCGRGREWWYFWGTRFRWPVPPAAAAGTKDQAVRRTGRYEQRDFAE